MEFKGQPVITLYTISDLTRKFNCTRGTVSWALDHYGISTTYGTEKKPLFTKDEMEELKKFISLSKEEQKRYATQECYKKEITKALEDVPDFTDLADYDNLPDHIKFLVLEIKKKIALREIKNVQEQPK